LSSPDAISFSLKSILFKISYIAFAISLWSCGFTSNAALPETSGVHPVFEQITGHSDALASSIGIPKPSYKEGNNRHRAEL